MCLPLNITTQELEGRCGVSENLISNITRISNCNSKNDDGFINQHSSLFAIVIIIIIFLALIILGIVVVYYNCMVQYIYKYLGRYAKQEKLHLMCQMYARNVCSHESMTKMRTRDESLELMITYQIEYIDRLNIIAKIN